VGIQIPQVGQRIDASALSPLAALAMSSKLQKYKCIRSGDAPMGSDLFRRIDRKLGITEILKMEAAKQKCRPFELDWLIRGPVVKVWKRQEAVRCDVSGSPAR